VYIGLRNGWAAGGIFSRLDFEKQIQTNELTHEALTNRRSAASIRSPLAPAASQIAFSVTIRHTASVSAVEIAILLTFLTDERRPRCDISKRAMLSGLETCVVGCIGFLAIVSRLETVFSRATSRT